MTKRFTKRPGQHKDAVPELVKVPLTAKQAAMVAEVEAVAAKAVEQRNLVLNTIAAAASYDGMCDYIGIEHKDGKAFLVLRPLTTPQ